MGSPDMVAAPLRMCDARAHQQSGGGGGNIYYCRKQEGRGAKNTGCTWETRLSSNSNTLKAPPTLMTFSVQSS